MAKNVLRMVLAKDKIRYRYYYYNDGKMHFSPLIYEDEGSALKARQDELEG